MLQSPINPEKFVPSLPTSKAIGMRKVKPNLFIETSALRKYFDGPKQMKNEQMCDMESKRGKHMRVDTNTDSDCSLTGSPCNYENYANEPKKMSTATNTDPLFGARKDIGKWPENCIQMSELRYFTFPTYGIREQCVQASLEEEINRRTGETEGVQKMGDDEALSKKSTEVQRLGVNHDFRINSILKEDGGKR